MNLKLNLKVLGQILGDLQILQVRVSNASDEKLRKQLQDEVSEKQKAARLLYDHYDSVLKFLNKGVAK